MPKRLTLPVHRMTLHIELADHGYSATVRPHFKDARGLASSDGAPDVRCVGDYIVVDGPGIVETLLALGGEPPPLPLTAVASPARMILTMPVPGLPSPSSSVRPSIALQNSQTKPLPGGCSRIRRPGPVTGQTARAAPAPTRCHRAPTVLALPTRPAPPPPAPPPFPGGAAGPARHLSAAAPAAPLRRDPLRPVTGKPAAGRSREAFLATAVG